MFASLVAQKMYTEMVFPLLQPVNIPRQSAHNSNVAATVTITFFRCPFMLTNSFLRFFAACGA